MEATHSDPVWRDRADFIIAAAVDPTETGVISEQLWARRIEDYRFEICCIPFFMYDLTLGDVVETTPEFLVERVSDRSGRYVFRVFFGETPFPRVAITSALASLGALMEWSSPNLLAVDAPDETRAQSIADFLQQQEDQRILVYETGKS
jgi:hypothetical protein